MNQKATQSLSFTNVGSPYLRECFMEAYSRFSELHDNRNTLEQLPLSGYTMRAQPVPGWGIISRNSRAYRVQMSNHLEIEQYIKVENLPREVLVGWFAHELGHILDYHQRSFIGLVTFLIGYLLFPRYRSGAERQADMFAVAKGFGKELLATKSYILDQSDLPDRYKDRIRKYYLSPDELETFLMNEEETPFVSQ